MVNVMSCLSQAASLALRLQQGQDVTCMGHGKTIFGSTRTCVPMLANHPDRSQPTLANGPLDVAHNQAVLVVQELDADLGDLQSEGSQIFSTRYASKHPRGSILDMVLGTRTWPREPVRPMTFMTMASLAG